MALKGSAKIELVNADGTKEVVEHGNMITDAVNDLLYSARGEQSNILRICNNGDSFIEQMFGGILLFKHTLSSDPADYYIPSVNTVGYASVSAYGGADIERGGFNASESGLQADGTYKLVWDFATSQANGTIQSIALCPNMMGKIGMSNSVVESEGLDVYTTRTAILPFSTNKNLLPSSGNTEGWSNYGYNIFAVIGNVAYAVHENNINGSVSDSIRNNGGVLKIFRFDVSANGVGLKSKVGSAAYIDCIDVQLPSDYTSLLPTTPNTEYSYDAESGKLFVYWAKVKSPHNEWIEPNDSLKYVEIDLFNNMTVSSKTFVNATGKGIPAGAWTVPAYSTYGTRTSIYILNNYIVMMSGENKMYVCKRNDNSDVKEVKWENGNEFVIGYCSFRPVFSFGNILVFGITQDTQYSNFKSSFVLDMSTGRLKGLNAKAMTYRGNTPLANKVTWGCTGTYLALSISVNPFVLCTKNNLDAPVTKTASQTMKITYTLTETAGV